jgi:hypothetical protein
VKKADVSVGSTYLVKVSGRIVPVRLDSESSYGGWNGTNTITGRGVRIKTAAKLRKQVVSRSLESREGERKANNAIGGCCQAVREKTYPCCDNPDCSMCHGSGLASGSEADAVMEKLERLK